MQNRSPWLPQEVERLSCRNRLVSSIIKVLLQIISPKPLNHYSQWDAGAPLMHHPHPPSSSFPKYSSIRAGHWWLTAHSQVPLLGIVLGPRQPLCPTSHPFPVQHTSNGWSPCLNSGFCRAIPAPSLPHGIGRAFVVTVSQPNFSAQSCLIPP